MPEPTDISMPKIGPYLLSSRVLLSPMTGITDAPFRAIARRFGAALTASEMTTADTSLWQTAKSRHRLDIDQDVEPRVVQIAGSDPQQLAEAARAVVDRGAQIIDINMGCPAKKVCRRLAGSALMQDEALVQQILEAVVNAVDVPVTLKTRTGWAEEHQNVLRIAKIAEQSGIAAIAIHGRTREARYRGEARYELIAEVKQALQIPVFANGDIDTARKAQQVMQFTGADGILIGRATQGRPWIFREISELLTHGRHTCPLSNAATHAIIRDHLDALHRFYGERRGILMARKHLNWYCRENGVSDVTRRELLSLRDAQAQRFLASKIFCAEDDQPTLAA